MTNRVDPFLDVLRGAYEHHAPDRLAGFPTLPGREPRGGETGTAKLEGKPALGAAVPKVPTVPGFIGHKGPTEPPGGPGDWEERAAIMEFDGGLSREEAERLAWVELSGAVPHEDEAALHVSARRAVHAQER